MLPSVTFRLYKPHLASARYRGYIPARQLHNLGFQTGKDWYVVSKHDWDWDETVKGYGRVCFDVCDDHFSDHLARHYRNGIDKADLVTCNSAEMARVIHKETGREATVIPDPYEQPEGAPRVGENLLWYGHASNLADLVPWFDQLKPLEIVTNLKQEGLTEWSPETMNLAFERAGLVVIPTGRSMAKSGNRAIESLRRGLFVIAGGLPAYADLGVYIGNIAEGVGWALNHQDEVLRRIKSSQAYIRAEYSPERIGQLWAKALCTAAS
jgi:hypothetical protein